MIHPAQIQLSTMTVDELAAELANAETERRKAQDYESAVKAEFVERFRLAHPGLEAGEAGSRQLTGDNVIASLSWDRDYTYDGDCLIELSRVLTAAEFQGLCSYEPKVNGTVFNNFLKRGGEVAELLARARKLKGTRPKITIKERE